MLFVQVDLWTVFFFFSFANSPIHFDGAEWYSQKKTITFSTLLAVNCSLYGLSPLCFYFEIKPLSPLRSVSAHPLCLLAVPAAVCVDAVISGSGVTDILILTGRQQSPWSAVTSFLFVLDAVAPCGWCCICNAKFSLPCSESNYIITADVLIKQRLRPYFLLSQPVAGC